MQRKGLNVDFTWHDQGPKGSNGKGDMLAGIGVVAIASHFWELTDNPRFSNAYSSSRIYCQKQIYKHEIYMYIYIYIDKPVIQMGKQWLLDMHGVDTYRMAGVWDIYLYVCVYITYISYSHIYTIYYTHTDIHQISVYEIHYVYKYVCIYIYVWYIRNRYIYAYILCVYIYT